LDLITRPFNPYKFQSGGHCTN